MDTGATDIKMDDPHIIREVLAGRRDQFQELVVRYADKVYAVAWSRLGDRHLAEEVVQETFIQGFQQLHRLKDAGKFLPWISSIARNKAINLGMRFRNELKRRERWALEQAPSDSSISADAHGDPLTKETLRETLASMNGAQRECLTLFYLQGKSVEEASKSLGITTGSFKTRLHRARAVLRAKLETLLETELSRFKPSDQVRHGIMAVVLAKSTSGTGLKAVGAWLPAIPFLSSLILLIQFVAMIPGFLLAKWTMKQTIDNLKDQEGYRARILRSNAQKIYWPIFIIVLVFFAFSIPAARAVALMLFLGLVLTSSVSYLLQYRVLKYQFPVSLYLGYIAVFICTGIGMYDKSFNHLQNIALGLCFVLSGVFSKRHAVGRLDHSIFLRMSDLMLKGQTGVPLSSKNAFPPTSRSIKSFVDFLAKENNVVSMRTEVDGVRVWLAPVQASAWRLMLAPFWRRDGATLFFGYDGTFKAHLSSKDRHDLIQLEMLDESEDAVSALEQKVEVGMKQASDCWSNGQEERAKLSMGYKRDEAIFHKMPERLSGNFFRSGFLALLGILMIFLGFRQQFDLHWGIPLELKRMQEPNITEAEAKAYIQGFFSEKVPSQVIRKRLLDRMSNSPVFPPVDWLTEENKQKIREYLDTFRKIDAWTIDTKRRNNDFTLQDLERYGNMQIPLASLFDLEFIEDIDWDEQLKKRHPRWKIPDRVWVNKNESFDVFAHSFQRRLIPLVGYVDLTQIDFSVAHQWLVNMQCLDTSKDFGPFKKVDLKRVHGLFLGNNSPLFDTWTVLSALEMSGGLDLIDREACIAGILRLHYGGGRFYIRAENSKKYVQGGHLDTWRAFQCLRILDALDRVKDLADWKFLLRRKFNLSVSLADRSKEFNLNGHHWDEVEAFLMQREFDAYVLEHLAEKTFDDR